MRGLKKLLILLCTMMLVMGMASAVQAAVPSTVTGLRAAAGEGKVALKWSKVKGATGYTVYRAVGNAAPVKVKKLKKNSVTLTKQNNGTTYTYYVSASNKSGEGAKSTGVSATPMMAGMAAPSLYVNWTSSNSVELNWSKVQKATGYEVFMVVDGQYNKIATTKKPTFYVENLTQKTTYSFAVRTYRKAKKKTSYGVYSNVVTTTSEEADVKATAAGADGSISGVHPYRWKGRVRRTVTLTGVNGTTATIKSGTKVTVTKRNTKQVTFEYRGTYFTTSRNDVKLYGLIWKANAYGDEIGRTFPNKAGYTSDTGWLIWLSTYSQRVFVYKGSAGNWVLQRSFPCSTGVFGMETGVGKTKIYGKQMTWYFNNVPCAHHASRISSGAFHTWAGGGFGRPASHGCVRVPTNQAVYIYNNCPKGTAVYLF